MLLLDWSVVEWKREPKQVDSNSVQTVTKSSLFLFFDIFQNVKYVGYRPVIVSHIQYNIHDVTN